MQNIASYTALTFSINFDKYLKQVNRLPYMVGTTVKYFSFTPTGGAGSLTYTDNLDVKRLIKTSVPYYPDKIVTTYTDTNLNFNYIFVNFSESGANKYVPYGGYYFKNTVTANDDVLDDSLNGIGYYSLQPTVNIYSYTLKYVISSK